MPSLELPHTHECFVCGESNPAGLRVRFVWEHNRVVARITLSEERCGYRGIAHGGVLSALLDETMGWAPAFAMRRMAVTAEMTVRFIKSVPIGVPLVVTGRFTADKRFFWQCEGEICGEDGTLYVTGKGKYVPLSAERSASIDYETLLYPEGQERIFV